MIALTTTEEQPGFAMYIDGYLKAEMSPYTGIISLQLAPGCILALPPIHVDQNPQHLM